MSLNGVRAVVSALLLVLWVDAAFAQTATETVQPAAENWLALVDSAQYGPSWQVAAAAFKNAVTEQKWTEAVRTVRGPLGALTSRAVKSSMAAKTLPGAPDGDYVVFQFNAVFEHKAAALETLTLTREPDGQWRVVGYFVR